MVTPEKIIEILYKSIKRFEKPYKTDGERIQIVFELDEKNEVVYTTCIDQLPKEPVQLSDMIGSNMYNFLVNRHIKQLLEKFAAQNRVWKCDINLLVGVKAGNHVYVNLRNKKELIRVINPNEL